MFLLRSVYQLVFGNKPAEPTEKSEPIIDIASLSIKCDSNKTIIAQNLDLENENKENKNICEQRIGKVMFVNGSEVIIDEGLKFDSSNSPLLNLNEGNRVAYIAYRKAAHHEWKVQKILHIVEEEWDKQLTGTKSDIIRVEPAAIPKDVLKRIHVCQVKERQARKLILTPGNLVCDLDKVKCQFIPLTGDWIELDVATEVNEKICDLGGDVLDVEEIRPLRSRIHVGIVTQWNGNNGTINKDTYFSKGNCEPGYSPIVGHSVVIEAIESEQGYLTWRALTVVSYGGEKHENKKCHRSNTTLPNDVRALLQNKRGIVISEVLNFGQLNLGEKKDIIAKIENRGRSKQILLYGKFHSKRSESQFKCTCPNGSEGIVISPEERLEYHFTCSGKFVGKASELFIFSFRGFKIGRYVEAQVQHPAQMQLLSSKGYCGTKYELPESYRQLQGNYISGVRPMKPPSFVPAHIGSYTVPKKLFDVIAPEGKNRNYFEKLENLKELEPHLTSELNISNYGKKFHTLLHIEEVQHVMNIKKYDMKRIHFRTAGPCGEFLALEVPGLAERRPSLLVGDRIVAVSSVEIDQEVPKPQIYEGFLHKIFQTEAWFKFHSSLHANYQEEEYNVSFLYGRTPMRRCHAAIDLAIKHLGPKMLFPTNIEVHPPQLHIEEDCDELLSSENNLKISEDHSTVQNQVESWQNNNTKRNISLIDYMNNVIKQKDEARNKAQVDCNLAEEFPELAKRKIKWLNPHLNSYQKNAVCNVLKGEACPLPYVIFGPPGTGKTMTLVEVILQTLILIPHSRILVATPSNSSADLLAERLLDSGILKPGDLVRLVGYHCIEEGTIPEKLIPYCTTGDIKLERDQPRSCNLLESSLKMSSTSKVLGRHRITVGTCICLGQLYTMGFTRDHFTHVFIDEAGQATEPELMIPLVFLNPQSGQVILAGDPLQLGPVVLSSFANRLGLADSYLSRLMQLFPYQRDEEGFPNTGGYNPLIITQLRVNYRSVPEIMELSNKLFYNRSIKSYVSQIEGPEAELLAQLAPMLPQRSLNHGGPPAIIFHGIRGQNFQDEESPSWFNPQEIVEALNYANLLYDAGLIPDDIGIITPYQKQVKKLRIFFEEFEVPVPKIGSVEEFQGQERKVIILSTVRSTLSLVKIDIEHSLGFVASPKRMNVSLTRARALLIILGNPHLLANDPLWKSVLKYCIDHKVYTGCDLPLEDDLWTLDEQL